MPFVVRVALNKRENLCIITALFPNKARTARCGRRARSRCPGGRPGCAGTGNRERAPGAGTGSGAPRTAGFYRQALPSGKSCSAECPWRCSALTEITRGFLLTPPVRFRRPSGTRKDGANFTLCRTQPLKPGNKNSSEEELRN